MDSQLFFYINAGIAAALLLWFWSARKNRGRTPTQLKLRNPDSKSPPLAKKSQQDNQIKKEQEASKASVDEVAARKAKALNILFMYNGHDWDAYAILGLPAGASLPLVTERYQQLIKDADAGQIQFYEAAYQAILKKF